MTPPPLPNGLQQVIDRVAQQYAGQPAYTRRVAMFRDCFANTYETTLRPMEDGSTFVITGDIPAMWLRDSSAQVRPYLLGVQDPQVYDLIAGVVRRQMAFIQIDPYANAFNSEPNGASWDPHDETDQKSLWLWERKYEIDSLCYPLQLAHLLWKQSGRTDHLDADYRAAAATILATWQLEQDHRNSPYFFRRANCPAQDTISHDGRGAPVAITGMTWSGFRPSDDACVYGYLIPANMFAVVALGYLAEAAEVVLADAALAEQARSLANEIRAGIAAHAIYQHPVHGPIYAYETDGFGNYTLMDDANVPSLLALPYLGWCDPTDPIYQNTRRFVLSSDNPFYYQGQAAKGIGSPHTPARYIWPIALSVQGLTSNDPQEQERLLQLLEATDAGTGLMHEGFHVDDPSQFTRPWFAWANSMYAELVLRVCGLQVTAS